MVNNSQVRDPMEVVMDILKTISNPIEMQNNLQRLLDLKAQVMSAIDDKNAIAAEIDKKLLLLQQAESQLSMSRLASESAIQAQKNDLLEKIKAFVK